jgi:hypothetical protein
MAPQEAVGIWVDSFQQTPRWMTRCQPVLRDNPPVTGEACLVATLHGGHQPGWLCWG